MTEQTIGQFLLEKSMNMSKWVLEEIGKENLPEDYEQTIAARTETEITYFCEVLRSNSLLVTHRDWRGLVKIDEVPYEMVMVLQAVKSRPDMHYKFWRYLEMFIKVMS